MWLVCDSILNRKCVCGWFAILTRRLIQKYHLSQDLKDVKQSQVCARVGGGGRFYIKNSKYKSPEI